MQTRDQQYASKAFEHVSRVKGTSDAASYGGMTHRLAILIHTSGLIQALTFAATRKEDGPHTLLDDLSETVLGKPPDKENLLALARGDTESDNLRQYILLTECMLSALLWYKRYAQAILDIDLTTAIIEEDKDAHHK